MKLDVEGFELEAILGSSEVFRKKRVAVLMVEIHDAILERRGKKSSDIVNFLESVGYTRDCRTGFTIFTV